MRFFKRLLLPSALFLLVLSLLLVSCVGGRGEYRRLQGGVWNTTYNISYASATDLTDSVLAVMKQVELSLSPFNDSSLISRINRGEPCEVDSLVRRIFLASQEVNRASFGRFDPTVAPLINLWGFGYRNSGVEPTQAMIDSVMVSVGIGDCQIDSLGRLQRKTPMTEFNFSAITKGYGCDLVGEMFRRNGCNDFMVEIGGEIAMRGRNPRGEDWHIMVDAPVENDTAVVHSRMAVMVVTDCGVATSGNYRNFKQTSSGRIWHTISTLDGRPAHTDLLAATVIAPTAMLADAYATACMALPSDSARLMLERVPDVEALFVTVNPSDSAFTITTTPGFPEIKR
ncbi:MAG: FAD:protein FMN transferase [Duncaniella sp.]|uniref:FAD:protein FMN transferase n=1 Tax=Duncaniella sp. TaxID=2518496 RepID=UPI0023C49648|nr:FAD:protein FMN transferase [Duncaniella sp.]MDE6091181.1 FAD:protein FMN transferase [Duncaniella sp.]